MNDWFRNCRTIEEARLEYRRLCFEHHPDHGGDTEIMQRINAAYDRARELLTTAPTSSRGSTSWRSYPRASAYHPPSDPPPGTEPKHSRAHVRSVWLRDDWHTVPGVGFQRTVWGHDVVIFQHGAAKFQGAWFVLLDDVISPYFYFNRQEAEQAAFDLLYEKVKFGQE